MRLWSLHPEYLDAPGLVATWREGLLAQHVLSGLTKGYRNHPQLTRFRETDEPGAFIDAYLMGIYLESVKRGYRFDGSKINRSEKIGSLPVTSGQIHYEWGHLMGKLLMRSPLLYASLVETADVKPHPLFHIVPGGPEPWEKRRQ